MKLSSILEPLIHKTNANNRISLRHNWHSYMYKSRCNLGTYVHVKQWLVKNVFHCSSAVCRWYDMILYDSMLHGRWIHEYRHLMLRDDLNWYNTPHSLTCWEPNTSTVKFASFFLCAKILNEKNSHLGNVRNANNFWRL